MSSSHQSLVTSHQSLEITHPYFQTCGALRQNPKRRVFIWNIMILRTRIRLKRISAQKNDRSPFLPIEKDATPAFPIEPAFPIAPSSHSYTA